MSTTNSSSRVAAIGLLVALLPGLLASCSILPAINPSSSEPVATGMPWWNSVVFYEIFVRSFYDSNGDGIGDFNGITQKLDYLEGLGIKGLWLMPIHPSPSYHGYDVTDYYAVNSDYGTMDDLKRLLSEAHKRGIRVTIDLVLNHTSAQHPWFVQSKDKASKYRDWYIWSDTDPGYLGPWDQKVWHSSASGYYYGVFWDQMPDLNYRNPEVAQEMLNVVKYWLDMGVDGFRVDGARHLIEEGKVQADSNSTLEWFKQFKPFYKNLNPQAVVVGEVWSTTFSAVRYVKEEGMDLTFDFDLASAWMKYVFNGNADNLSKSTLFENSLYPNQQMATFLTNHDMNRVMSTLMGNVDKAKAAATVLLTSPGVPFIYYGEEIGVVGQKPDEQIRTPMQWTGGDQGGFTTGRPWESLQADYPNKNVEAQSKDPASLLNHYKKLIQARNQHVSLQVGDLVRVNTGNSSVYAMLRSTDKETTLVLINLGQEIVSNYALEFNTASLKGRITPKALVGEGKFADLNVNEQGVVQGYKPLGQLPANANLVLLLKP